MVLRTRPLTVGPLFFNYKLLARVSINLADLRNLLWGLLGRGVLRLLLDLLSLDLILFVFFELLLRLVRCQLGVRRALRQATRGSVARARLGRRGFLLSGASRAVNRVFVLPAH